MKDTHIVVLVFSTFKLKVVKMYSVKILFHDSLTLIVFILFLTGPRFLGKGLILITKYSI